MAVDVITPEQFILEVRRLGGFETLDPANSFVTDDEILSRGNANLRKVYLALVRARESNYFRTTAYFQTVAGKSLYNFSEIGTIDENGSYISDTGISCLEVLSLSRKCGSGWEPLVDFNESERDDDCEDWSLRFSVSPMRFAMRANGIELQPTPVAVEMIRLNYIPGFVPMALGDIGNPEDGEDDVAAISFEGYAGFHEWAIWETVAELQAKDMVDPSLALGKASWWEREVESMARQRYAGGPRRVNRVRARRRRRCL